MTFKLICVVYNCTKSQVGVLMLPKKLECPELYLVPKTGLVTRLAELMRIVKVSPVTF